MTQPRFLADEDLRAAIRSAVLRHDPRVEFPTIVQMGWGGRPDDAILDLAAAHGLIVVSHDMRTMPGVAAERIRRSAPMAGLMVAPQLYPVSPIADELILIWFASTAEEWIGRIEYLPL